MQDKTNAMVVAKSLEKQALPIVKKLQKLSVTTEEEYQKAAVLLKQLKNLAKAAKVEEAKITDPIDQALKATRAHFKPFHNSVSLIEEQVKQAMGDFLTLQESRQQKVLEDFKTGKIKRIGTALAKQDELNVTSDVAVVRKARVIKVTDVNKIPRKFMMPDMEAIKAAYKKGLTVPGTKENFTKQIAI